MRIVERLRGEIQRLWNWIRSPHFNELLTMQFELRPYLHGVPYWTAGVVVGLVAVLYSNAFSWCIEFSKWLATDHPEIYFVSCPIFFVLAVWVVEKFAPAAGGTGVPRVIHALSLDSQTQAGEIHQLLNLRVALVIIVSSLLCILGGGGLGREGPVVHIGACLFYCVGRLMTKTFPYQEHRSWIVAGSAAGVAAAFNAPLAGVVFALEELAQAHFHRFKTEVITAAIIGGVICQWISGRYLYLGYPSIGSVPFSAIPWAIFVGIVCGLAALPFLAMNTPKFQNRFSSVFTTKRSLAIFIGICSALMAVFLDVGSIGGGISTIQQALFDMNHEVSWSLIIVRYLNTALSHLSGCAGGFLAPSLALGAVVGSKVAEFTGYEQQNLLVMVGMAAFLSAVVRAPFTAWVIVMEMTDRHSAIFPLMIASLVSSATVRLFLDRKPKVSV